MQMSTSIEYFFEIMGTFVFAISAILASEEEKHDWFASSMVAFVTAIGGGTLRDVLLGIHPLVWIEDLNILYAIFNAIIICWIFFPFLSKRKKLFFYFDALGISFFTILGTERAMTQKVHPEIAAIMGMLSAVMGGVIRDTLMNKIPVIFRREIYATACLAGAIIYLFMLSFQFSRNTSLIVAASFIVVIRIVSVHYNLGLPVFRTQRKNS